MTWSTRAVRALLTLLAAAALALGLVAPSEAATTGAISGVVRAGDTGARIAGATVKVWGLTTDGFHWSVRGTTTTSSQGTFTLSGLRPGDYRLEASGKRVGDVGYAGEFYDNQPGITGSAPITVRAGQTKALVKTIDLAGGRSVSGTVSGAQGSGGVTVTAYRKDRRLEGDTTRVLGRTTTDAAGQYRIDTLPAAEVIVRFTDPEERYVPVYYDADEYLEYANTIDLRAATTRPGVDASLADAGSISGIVRDSATGKALRGADVAVLEPVSVEGQSDIGTARAITGADGRYRVTGIRPGRYRVLVLDDDHGYNPLHYGGHPRGQDATIVTVTARRNVPNIDVRLSKPGGMSGHVTAGGKNIGVRIELLRRGPSGWYLYFGYSARTEGDGSYGYDGLDAGTYTVRYVPSSPYVPEYYGNAYREADARRFTVGSGAQVKNVDARLEVGATVSGTVTRPAGVTDAVSKVVAAVDTRTGEVVKRTTASGSGTRLTYSMGGLRPGSYRVEFARAAGTTPLSGQFYRGVSESRGASSASRFALAGAQRKSGVDATLWRGGTIRGRLLDGDGTGRGCDVHAEPVDDDHSRRTARSSRVTGDFAITGLSAGRYRVFTTADRASDSDCRGASDAFYVENDTNQAHRTGRAADATIVTITDTKPVDLTRPMYGWLSYNAKTFATNPTPTVSGAAGVGRTLSATLDGTSSPAESEVRYQWFSGTQTQIPDATSPTFTITPDQAGTTVFVRTIFVKAGYALLPTFSTPVRVGAHNTRLPVVNGTMKVGQVATLDRGSWAGTGWSFTYRWYRGTAPISGATSSSYRLTSADRGQDLSVHVQAVKDGYPSAIASSAGRPVS